MPVDGALAQAAVSVVAGAIAGGVTNQVAVWMLFHPYERRFGIQGAIPKNKSRLARSLGRTVGERLLTPTDLLGELAQSGVREAFDAKIHRLVSDALETERGTVRELIAPSALPDIERLLRDISNSVVVHAGGFLDSPEFDEKVHAFVTRSRKELSKQSLGELLPRERREDLARRANAWADEFSRSEELERGVREYLSRHAEQLLASNDPLVERIPPSVLSAVEGAIDSYLPVAASRLGNFLAQPASRDKLRTALHGVFGRFVHDLRLHERIIAKIVVTERTFDKALDALERDGVEQLASLLEDPAVRDEITRSIHEAVLSFLRKPIAEILGDGGERAAGLVEGAGDYLLRVLRDERTRAFLIDKVEEVARSAEHRTVGDMLATISDESVVHWISDSARSARARELIAEGIHSGFRRLLDVRIGRPGRFLPADSVDQIAAAISRALWEWVNAQLPDLIHSMDIQAMVERKVQAFSTERVEEIIRGVTERELKLIVKLGYALGAIIGLFTFGIGALTGGS